MHSKPEFDADDLNALAIALAWERDTTLGVARLIIDLKLEGRLDAFLHHCTLFMNTERERRERLIEVGEE